MSVSLKRNISYSFLGQLYVAIIGLLIYPFYLKFFGAEAYGLIGFFLLMQSWFVLLDLGLTPTLAREAARLKAGSDKLAFLNLQRSLEIIFLAIAVLTAVSVFASKGWLVQNWLKVTHLPAGLVEDCIAVMGIISALRMYSALHRGALEGFEEIAWVNILNVVTASLRHPIMLGLIWLIGLDIFEYFICQLVVSLVEQVFLQVKLYKVLPKIEDSVSWISISRLKEVAPFALSSAYSGAIWVFVSQLDKLIMSSILPLAEFGYFSLVSLLSNAILILGNPISKVVLPRFTALVYRGEANELALLYRKSTRLVVCLVAPVTSMLIIYPDVIVFVWTQNMSAANWVAPVLPLYAAGMAVLSIVAFLYYLQYAYGKLNLHVKYNTVSAVLSLPSIVFFAYEYGAVGVGFVWLLFRLITLLAWSPYIHKKYLPGIHWHWLFKDVLIPGALCFLIAFIPCFYVSSLDALTRIQWFMFLFIVCLISLTFGLITFIPYKRFSLYVNKSEIR